MLMFFAIFKFGIALNANLALTDGVRAGAREFAIGRGNASVYSQATQRFHSAAAMLAKDDVVLELAVDGAVCSNDASCLKALDTGAGKAATLVASYPCDLQVLGFDFAPGCMLSSRTSERVE